MSFRGLQLINDFGHPFISLSSIRNTAEIEGETLKAAMKSIRMREHRIFITWGKRKFHTNCIRLKDLPALNLQLGGKLSGELVDEISTEYRNLI